MLARKDEDKAGDGRSTVYNNIVTPEKLEKVNKKNIQLGDDFLEYISSIGMSESTIYQYGNNLKIFWCWNLEFNDNKFFVKIRKRDFQRLQAHAKDIWGWSPKRVRTFRATLSSLSDYIYKMLDDEYDGYKPIIKDVPHLPDCTVREKIIYTARELQKILDQLVEDGEYYKACVLSVAMNSGRRKSELARFKVDYFDKSNLICEGALYKTPEKMTTKGRGKNGKLLDVYTLAKPVQPYIDLWLEERKRLKIRSKWLFPRYEHGEWKDEPVKVTTLDSFTKTYARIAGKHFYWHSMRHYLVTYLSESNIPSTIIQDMIGWESSDMVKLYDDTGKDDHLEKFFGADGIKTVNHTNISELY